MASDRKHKSNQALIEQTATTERLYLGAFMRVAQVKLAMILVLISNAELAPV